MKRLGQIKVGGEGNRKDPKPFPGIYPTRWMISMTYYERYGRGAQVHSFHYKGKPSTVVADFVARKNGRGALSNTLFIEYDRGGPWRRYHFNPAVSSRPLEVYSEDLRRFYYPFQVDMASISPWGCWLGRQDRVQMVYKGKKHMIYCPRGVEIVSAATRGIKQWLDGANLTL